MSVPKMHGPRRMKEETKKACASDYKEYLEKGKIEEMDIYYHGCTRDWDEDFQSIAMEHGKLNNNIAMEFTENWSPEETQKMGFDKLYELAVKNAHEAFPDHAFVSVPHVSDNGGFHVHTLYCTISNLSLEPEKNGVRLKDKGYNRRIFNRTVDKTAKENGLSTVSRNTSKQKERFDREDRFMMKRGINPATRQIMQTADYGRRIAVNFADFVNFMGDMGIRVEERGQSLSYHHPRKKQPIRCRRLGTNYSKEGLSEAFAKNAKEFKSRPTLQLGLNKEARSNFDGEGNHVGDSSKFPFHPGGHQVFDKQLQTNGGERAKLDYLENRETEYDKGLYRYIRDSVIKAASSSIPEYCRKNGIELLENKDGSYRLKGRDYIHINETSWFNNKSKKGRPVGTAGSLIEFAANHKDLTFYGAVAEITGNKNVLLVEEFLGKEKRTYKEFHVPKSKRASEKDSKSAIDSLVSQMGFSSKVSRFLYDTKKVQVTTKGAIRFLLDADTSGGSDLIKNIAKNSDVGRWLKRTSDVGKITTGALEFSLDKSGKWQKKLLGSTLGHFLSEKGGNKKLSVFKDPFSFMKETGEKGAFGFKHGDGFLVLGDGDFKGLQLFLANNKNVKEIDLLGFDAKELTPEKKMEITKYGVKLNFVSRAGRSRSKGPELSL